MHQVAEKKANTLNSWKEIATYLGHGVRTVQRWESQLKLPVHRLGAGNRSPVFAFPAELDRWFHKQGMNGNCVAKEISTGQAGTIERPYLARASFETSVLLTQEMIRLLEVQRTQTKILTERLTEMARLLNVLRTRYTPPAILFPRRLRTNSRMSRLA